MTPEERFERIEANMLAVSDAMKVLVQSQTGTQQAITDMAKSISQYIDGADARMKLIESNLDALIKAITAEHSNGKKAK